ncbi:MAG: hypothetical protein GXO86_12120 [Chlorobi bacterium]|nr:hypothetical protein [Chlorobiota bacterium]
MRRRMRAKKLAGLAIMIITVFSGLPSSAQTLEVGLFGGGSYYLGEMNTGTHFKNTNLAYGILGRLNTNRRLAYTLSYYRGTIEGTDNVTGRVVEQDYSFKTHINDISATVSFNFLEYFTGSKRHFWTPYVFGGIGFSFSRLSTALTVPFGLGFKFGISEHLGLGVEWGMRKTFTDYLDGVNFTEYQNGLDTGSDKTSTWDWYNFFGINITYKINLRSKLKCNLEGW